MYSAVLMLALTAGNESVDFGRNRCQSSCASSCSATAAKVCSTTSKSSCSSSCNQRHGLFANRCHGCTASTSCTKTVVAAAPACSKSHGCSTSSSCRGGLFGGHRNRGCASTSGCASTCSTVIIEKKKEMPKGEKVAPPKTPVAATATIVISLPADARLIVDGAPTTSTSDRRTLVTPELDFGSTYVYTVRAEVVQNGQIVAQTQEVQVRGGETSTVRFNFSTQGIASR